MNKAASSFEELEQLCSPQLRFLSKKLGMERDEIRSVAWICWRECCLRFNPGCGARFETYWLSAIQARARSSGGSRFQLSGQLELAGTGDDPAAILQAVQEVGRLMHLAEPAPRKKNCTPRHLRRLAQQARERAETAMLAGVAV